MSLRDATLSFRVFATTILLTLGFGFALSLVYLFAQEVKPQRTQGHRLVQGAASTYHGAAEEPRLLVALRGSMANTVTPKERLAFEEWIAAGATEEDYAAEVGPIVEETCASCHDADGFLPTLTGFEEVLPLTRLDSGMDVKKLARMTHVHLLGVPLLFYILGALFVRTRFREGLKAVLVVAPFLGIMCDISHWWLTKQDPSHALGVIVGGTLMSVGFASQWCLALWDLWLPLPAGRTVAEREPRRARPTTSSARA